MAGLRFWVLLMLVGALLPRLSIFKLKVSLHDLRVDDAVPSRVLLDVRRLPLDTPLTGFLQRSSCFQKPRASSDLMTYSTKRYTPRKAVARVKTHSAG